MRKLTNREISLMFILGIVLIFIIVFRLIISPIYIKYTDNISGIEEYNQLISENEIKIKDLSFIKTNLEDEKNKTKELSVNISEEYNMAEIEQSLMDIASPNGLTIIEFYSDISTQVETLQETVENKINVFQMTVKVEGELSGIYSFIESMEQNDLFLINEIDVNNEAIPYGNVVFSMIFDN